MKKKIMMSLVSFVFLSLITKTGLVHGEWSLSTMGYFSASALSGGLGTKGGAVNPKNTDDVFLTVVMSVPSVLFVPTEAEYGRMKKSKHSNKELAPRTHIKLYQPNRFSLILSNGRSFTGVLITFWPVKKPLGFSTNIRFAEKGPVEKRETDQIAVAFIIPKVNSKPPFRIQIDRDKPVTVAKKELEVPTVWKTAF
ncbi:MAG: hypothetical protein PVG65_04635 [Candidatus Thorarchaeota archaeon]|jgi:hypothetical protein